MSEWVRHRNRYNYKETSKNRDKKRKEIIQRKVKQQKTEGRSDGSYNPQQITCSVAPLGNYREDIVTEKGQRHLLQQALHLVVLISPAYHRYPYFAEKISRTGFREHWPGVLGSCRCRLAETDCGRSGPCINWFFSLPCYGWWHPASQPILNYLRPRLQTVWSPAAVNFLFVAIGAAVAVW